MKKKMVALDIDGTLVDKEGKLTPRTAKAISGIKDMGVNVVLATGRRYFSCRELINELAITLPVVTHNGALVLSSCGQEVFQSRPLDAGWLPGVLAEMEEQQIDHYLHSLDNIWLYREPRMEWGAKHLEKNKDFVEWFEFSSFPNRPFHRVMAVGSKEQISGFLQESTESINGSCRYIHFTSEYHEMDILEFLHPQANKASGLKFIAENLGVKPDEILAVGDETNDIEMIKWAGLGVAMGNALPGLKEEADLVCGNNDEDGLAELLEKIYLL